MHSVTESQRYTAAKSKHVRMLENGDKPSSGANAMTVPCIRSARACPEFSQSRQIRRVWKVQRQEKVDDVRASADLLRLSAIHARQTIRTCQISEVPMSKKHGENAKSNGSPRAEGRVE